MSYSTIEDVKSLLDITTNNFDVQIARCIMDADEWIKAQVGTFNLDSNKLRTLSRLYAGHLFRNSIVEGHTDTSGQAGTLRDQAIELIQAYKKNQINLKLVECQNIK